jgi:Uma2 family endonuclease
MATLPKLITYEEWLEMPVVDDHIEEVVNGEIQVMPPNKLPHPIIITHLTAAFDRQLDRIHTLLLASTFGLVIRTEPLVCRSPDMAIFELSTIVEKDGYIHSAPQFIIEVLSPSESRKEITGKLRDYESGRPRSLARQPRSPNGRNPPAPASKTPPDRCPRRRRFETNALSGRPNRDRRNLA